MKSSRQTKAIDEKIGAAISILKQLGLPPKQQNDRSARTLLALLGIRPNDAWRKAANTPMGIHEIIGFIAKNYNYEYAENSRESIRRQTIHQFEQAGLIEKNPDDPSRPTNSGKTVYAITDAALITIRGFDSRAWQGRVKRYRAHYGSLVEKYQGVREMNMLPLTVDGVQYYLSSGKHNELQKAIINEFGPRFASGAEVLYLGDTAQKATILKVAELKDLGIPFEKHNKLPDIVLWHAKKKWIFLIEAVTSHGPVSPKRFTELEKWLAKCKYERIYVSAFLEFRMFNKHSRDVAWETEVWIAEFPEHLIHFNGNKFLGPA